MYYLFILLCIVVLYKFYSLKEGFYSSINPCFDKKTPYIKFDKTFVCFDEKNKVENTLNVFYGKEKDCYIEPLNSTMSFYNIDGVLIDTVKESGNKVCKPYKVNII